MTQPLSDRELEELLEQATPGPWRVGAPSYKCSRHGEPGHVHDSDACEYVLNDWYGHDVYAPELTPKRIQGRRNPPEDAQGLIAGQWDYEEGGVYREADARLIAAAPALAEEALRLRGALRSIENIGDRSAVMVARTALQEGSACEHLNHSFDRSICACGSMHYYCTDCGAQVDECREEALER